MAYNGSGVFTLIAGNPVVTGTTISSTWANNTLSDIATGLSTAVTKDGQTTPTANIPMGGFKLTGLAAGTVNGDAVRFEQVPAMAQAQNGQYYTTGGTTTAYTLTPTPAITSLVAGQRFNVVFNAANTTASTTLAISGLTAKTLKVYNSSGAKTDPAIGALALNMISDVEYDGVDYVVLNQLPAATVAARYFAGVRQTVMAASVDSSGYPNFLTTSVNLNLPIAATSFPIRMTAANGVDANGPVDVFGSTTADTTLALAASSTLYVYGDINSTTGVITYGSGTLQPSYIWGGTPSTTNGQFTFVISTMTGYVGNGSAAVQTNRVYIGEAVTSGSAVTSIVNYALNGRYKAPAGTTIANGTRMSFNHNIGVNMTRPRHVAQFVSAVRGYAVGDQIELSGIVVSATLLAAFTPSTDRLTVGAIANSSGLSVQEKSVASFSSIALTDVNYIPQVERAF